MNKTKLAGIGATAAIYMQRYNTIQGGLTTAKNVGQATLKKTSHQINFSEREMGYRNYTILRDMFLEHTVGPTRSNQVRLVAPDEDDTHSKYKDRHIMPVFSKGFGTFLMRLPKSRTYVIFKNSDEVHDNKTEAYVTQMNQKLLQISCFTKKQVDEVFELIDNLFWEDAQGDFVPTLFRANKYGSYGGDRMISNRPDYTVFLNEGVKESLFADMDQFLSAKEDYTKASMPYHRGYIFYGPAGTGKTSFARVLASKYKMNVYTASLKEFEGDSSLAHFASVVDKNTIILIEDIDTFNISRERTDGGITMGGLLNFFDGIDTPEDCIFIATTNHLDRLEPALMRPGRFDICQKFDYLDQVAFEEMTQTLLGVAAPGLIQEETTAGQISNAIRSNFGNLEETIQALLEFCQR